MLSSFVKSVTGGVKGKSLVRVGSVPFRWHGHTVFVPLP